MAPDPKPGASHVEWIAVLPEARGGGIGAALLTHAFSAVKQDPWNARSIDLGVMGGNRPNVCTSDWGSSGSGRTTQSKNIAGCVICFFMGCPNRDPCAGFTYSDMVKAL